MPPYIEADLVERISRLEQQNRSLKISGVCAVALLGGAFLMGATPKESQPLKTNRLVIVDEDGKERAVLGFHERKTPRSACT